MRTLFLVASLMIGGSVSAQQASYTYINQPPPYSNPQTPFLVALNTPKLGTSFKVQVSMSNWWWWWWGCQYGWVNYYLLTGVTNPAVDLGFGVLFSSGEVVIASRVGSGMYDTMSFALPASSSLIGVPFYQQVVELSEGYYGPYCSYSWGVALSRGGHGVIGT